MKHIRRLLLPALIVPALVSAEITALDDSVLGGVTGQAGITIDLEAAVSIGEIAYKDGGFITLQGLRLGGMDRTAGIGVDGKIDNARLKIDVASAGELLDWGFSDFGTIGGGKRLFNEGDLVLHFTNIGNLPPYTFSARGEEKVDFGLELDRIGLEGENYIDSATGLYSGSAGNSTTLASNIKMEGWFGPTDIIIRNNGNGFDTNGVANSKIEFNSMFRIDDMEMDVDIVGVSLKGMKIFNSRGDFRSLEMDGSYSPVVGSNTFAQVNGRIFALDNAIPSADVTAPNVDGIGIEARFIADMDIGHVSFGDTGTSIGVIYLTDIDLQATLHISAH